MCRRLSFSTIGGAVLLLAGCGPSVTPVTGTVTLDGAPVDGATVSFALDGGTQVYVGFTDASGNFSLSQGEKLGALPGNYKVMVVKTPKIPGAEGMSVDSPDYMKMAQKEAKTNTKTAGPMMTPGMPGAMRPPGSPAPAGLKSELPAIYSSFSTTTLTATVPSQGPIVLELTGGGKIKK